MISKVGILLLCLMALVSSITMPKAGPSFYEIIEKDAKALLPKTTAEENKNIEEIKNLIDADFGFGDDTKELTVDKSNLKKIIKLCPELCDQSAAQKIEIAGKMLELTAGQSFVSFLTPKEESQIKKNNFKWSVSFVGAYALSDDKIVFRSEEHYMRGSLKPVIENRYKTVCKKKFLFFKSCKTYTEQVEVPREITPALAQTALNYLRVSLIESLASNAEALAKAARHGSQSVKTVSA